MDFLLFLKAVAKHWWILLSCAAFTILGIYGLYFSKDNDWLVRSSLRLAGFLLLASCFLAWRDEHKQVTELQAQPPREGPDFHPSIVNSLIYPAGDPTNSVVGIVGTIYNKGESGTLNDIFIDAIFDDGRRIRARLAYRPQPAQTVTFGSTDHGAAMTMPGTLYWLNQKTTPIQKFGRLDGFAMGLLENVTFNELREKPPLLVLTCTDILDRPSSAEVRWGSGTSATKDFGLEDLQRPLPKN
jgi:hypothetical protein